MGETIILADAGKVPCFGRCNETEVAPMVDPNEALRVLNQMDRLERARTDAQIVLDRPPESERDNSPLIAEDTDQRAYDRNKTLERKVQYEREKTCTHVSGNKGMTYGTRQQIRNDLGCK